MALLHIQDDMIERMELDLSTKAAAAFEAAGVGSVVHGVFSLDDLENKTENDLGRKIAVGVSYFRAGPLEITDNPKSSATAGQSTSVKLVAYDFMVLLAVPTGEECLERYNATKLLTVLRRSIHGSIIDGDGASRRWNFQTEKPVTDQSTETMLYYSQLWQVALPLVGPSIN